MNTSKRNTPVLLPALMALAFGPLAPAAGAESHVRHRIVAASGAAAPAGGNYGPVFFNVALNARHQAVFDALLAGPSTSGVFVDNGRRTTTIALGGNPDPAAGNFSFVFDPFITRHGAVVFNADFRHFFRSDRRTIVPLVRAGDAAPGGGTLTPRTVYAANDRAVIAYAAGVSDSTATAGIFRSDGTETVAIARDDVDAPTGGTFVSLRDPVINDRGQVAFDAEISGGSADFAIFRGEGGDLTTVFAANQPAPGGGIFTDFGNPVINRHGEVAAVASLAETASRLGLFVGDESHAVAVALQGRPAPKGGNYVAGGVAFAQPLRLNDRGEVAFHVGLSGGTSRAGLFRGNGHHTTTIALAGTPAPGTSGTFDEFLDVQLGGDGRVAFIAKLALGVGGVNSSNDMGIWVGTSDANLRLVVRTGESIAGKLLTALPTVGGFRGFDMNQNSVVWIGTFGSARAVVLSRVLGGRDGGGESDDSDER